MTTRFRIALSLSAATLALGLAFAPVARAEPDSGMKKDTMGKTDTMKKDTMGKDDAMKKDTMGKDAMGKDAMKKDTMGKDTMGKTDTMKK
jgi:pentapeptide MXKDX repeat protein